MDDPKRAIVRAMNRKVIAIGRVPTCPANSRVSTAEWGGTRRRSILYLQELASVPLNTAGDRHFIIEAYESRSRFEPIQHREVGTRSDGTVVWEIA